MPFDFESAFARERERIAVPTMPLASIRRRALHARAHGPRTRASVFLAACGAAFAFVLSALPAAGAVV